MAIAPRSKCLKRAKRVYEGGVPVKGCGRKAGWEEPSGSRCAARGGCTGDRRTLKPHVIGCAQGEAVRNLLAGLIPPGALGRSSTSPLCRQSKETARAAGLLPLNTSGSRNWENSLGGVKRDDLASHLHVLFSPGFAPNQIVEGT